MKLNLYVIVNDMPRAVTFYRQLFQREPAMTSDEYVTFDLDGALYGLFLAAVYPVPVAVGNNCVPNLYVDDIYAEYNRLLALPSAFRTEIRRNGPYELFLLADPDGTALEIYTQAAD
jgi:predicted enzyme related to lactoylglutathione lyase